ncbi:MULTISPECIES: hypothetical protein [Bacillus]|uniref:hypothetical protein n=1 Tax=Bacillus TaxID=1386 RepID=UPI000C78EBCA|nr:MULTISPECIES: hypothetical protein [Bacillus]MCP1161216.1 hypothetical protein [Bacillus infantis]PLR70541.1 hypothetical protein CYJ37_23700 [Bacillus sp. UMB0728]
MTKPDFRGLHQLDTAILLQKLIILNGMVNYGTDAERKKALKELPGLEAVIKESLNTAAFNQAKYELNITDQDLAYTEPLQSL